MTRCNTYRLVAQGSYSSGSYIDSYLYRRPSRFSMSCDLGQT